jgi:hypothetical protein
MRATLEYGTEDRVDMKLREPPTWLKARKFPRWLRAIGIAGAGLAAIAFAISAVVADNLVTVLFNSALALFNAYLAFAVARYRAEK